MKNSLFILALFTLGVVLGIKKYLPNFIIESDLSMYVLYALMFFVGIGIGADKSSWKVIRQTNIKILLVPISIVIGSLLGGLISSLFLPEINGKEAMAVAAGFGYYSLSSIFITEISGETLGVIALLSNISREIITLVATPILVRYFGKLAGISAGGATSMDTTLPIITQYTGKQWSVIAIFSGIVLTLIVPLIVPLILNL